MGDLDKNTIEIIEGLLPVLSNDKTRGEIVTAFYDILLNEKYPKFKKIFNTSNQSSGKQINALFMALLQFFSKIESIDEKQIIEIFKPVMIKHVSLGVKEDDYQKVGECLVDAIEKTVIPKISEGQISAIEKAYSYLSDVFIEEEAKIYETIESEELGGWKGECEFTITKIEEESKDGNIKSFYLKPKDNGKILKFEAGDYITISAKDQLRQYSLSNYGKGAEYRITVKREEKGCVSTYLHALKKRETVKIRPPVGIFHLKKEHIEGKLPIILLSSGNGLTPVLSMLHKLNQEKYQGKVYYIHCTRNRETHAMEKEVKDMANENIKIFNFYSQEKEASGEYIMQRINKGSLQEILKDEKIDDCRFYCCGSERWFIGEGNGGVKDLLTDMEVRKDQIFTENFGPSFAIATREGSPSLNAEKRAQNKEALQGSRKKCQEKRAFVRSIVVGCSTAVLGFAVAVTFFAIGAVAIELMTVVIALVTIAAVALGGITYAVLKPNTEMNETGCEYVHSAKQCEM